MMSTWEATPGDGRRLGRWIPQNMNTLHLFEQDKFQWLLFTLKNITRITTDHPSFGNEWIFDQNIWMIMINIWQILNCPLMMIVTFTLSQRQKNEATNIYKHLMSQMSNTYNLHDSRDYDHGHKISFYLLIVDGFTYVSNAI